MIKETLVYCDRLTMQVRILLASFMKTKSITSVKEALELYRDKGAFHKEINHVRVIVSWFEGNVYQQAIVRPIVIQAMDKLKQLKKISISDHFSKFGWPLTAWDHTRKPMITVYAAPGEVDQQIAESNARMKAQEKRREQEKLERQRKITLELCRRLDVVYSDHLVEAISDIMQDVSVNGF